jgi:SPASM domain peptide maturase of grasp-with-spasm system
MNNYFVFFTSCFLIKGFNRSLIIDSQRAKFETIPNSMYDILKQFKNKLSIDEVFKKFNFEERIILNEYLDYLIENEYGLIVNNEEFDLFIDMDLNFELPYYATNCIIELSPITINYINKLLSNLEKIHCKNVQLITYEDISFNTIQNILELTKNSNFKSIELVLKYSNELYHFITNGDYYKSRITKLIFHSTKTFDSMKHNEKFEIKFLKKEIKNFTFCGIVNENYFDYINKFIVLESLNHNSCLNRKISIDKDGYIRNCPSMPQHYGNIKDTTLEEALNHPDFKKYWNVNKDMIEVCKDCEFRHICTDCRAYTERTHFDGEIDLSKPLKCGYNPYTNEWAEWSTNPLKEKAIEYYDMQDLVKKNT